MTSTQAEIDLSYSVSNDFFELWLDKNLHYTSAAWDNPEWDLETAQEHKAKVLYDFAELDGDPLEPATRIQMVILEGENVYEYEAPTIGGDEE